MFMQLGGQWVEMSRVIVRVISGKGIVGIIRLVDRLPLEKRVDPMFFHGLLTLFFPLYR